MPRITKIEHKDTKNRFYIFVDGFYCCSIRERTFSGMKLTVGQEITCEEIKELEKHHWKYTYGQAAWDKEKVRLNRVKQIIENINPNIKAKITGFGADSNNFIPGHPKESGKPDIEVVLDSAPLHNLLMIEVTGTENMRPGTTTYWVRPDKLNYVKRHPEEDVWIILHYAQPTEKLVFIKPNCEKEYITVTHQIRGSFEYYVEFSDQCPEVFPQEYFETYLLHKIAKEQN